MLAAALLGTGAFFLVGCGGGGNNNPIFGGNLTAPTGFAYDADAGRITWSTVSNANRYYVSINGGAEQPSFTAYFAYSTTEQFTVKVRAESSGNYTEATSEVITFVPLDTVQNVAVDDSGNVTWQIVDGATGYEVYLNNVMSTVVTECAFTQVPVGKTTTVAVKPTVVEATSDLVYFSKRSQTVSVNILNAIDVTKISYDDGRITWPAVTGASGYEVTIRDTEVVPCTSAQYEFDAANSDFTVSVRAIGNHTSTYDSAPSEKRSFVYLQQAQNLRAEDGMLKWDEVEGATSYRISDGVSKLAEVTACEYDKLVAGRAYDLTVLPMATAENTSYFSTPSATLTVTILPAPVPSWSGLSLDGNEAEALNWQPVNGAASYVYELTKPNGETSSNSLAGMSYSDSFTETGTHRVRIKAVAQTGTQYSDSKYSPAIIVERLPAPTVTDNNITSFPDDLSRGFGVTFDGVNLAVAYQLYKGGVSSGTRSTNTAFTVTDAGNDLTSSGGNVDYKIQSIGTTGLQPFGNANERRIILSSLTSSTLSAFTVTVLPTPAQEQAPIDGTVYSYGTVAGASGYAVDISGTKYNGGEGQYDLNSLASGTFNVRVCAKGNGKKILPSAYTEALSVTRLAQPRNVRISTENTSDGVLAFEYVDHADSYDVVFTDNDVVPVTGNTFPNLKSKITTAGTTINVVSRCNRWDNGTYYMDSPMGMTNMFFKLAAPGDLRFTNDQMLWNEPQNGGNVQGITYRIFDGADNTAYNEVRTARSLSLASFGAGLHSFRIVAVGNGTQYINSDEAAFGSITKLEQPTLSVNTAAGVYEWYGVAQASNYRIRIDGEDKYTVSHIEHGTGKYEYKPSYNTVNNQGIKVELYAEGDGGLSTVNSNVCEYMQKTAKLTTPAFEYKYGSDRYEPNATITVHIKTGSEHATAYRYSVGGAIVHESAATEYVYSSSSAISAVPIFVSARGGSFDEEEIYYIDSDNAPTRTLTVLTTPDADAITLSRDGILTVPSVTGAASYLFAFEITYTDGTTGEFTYDTLNKTERVDVGKVLREKQSVEEGFAAVRNLKIAVYAKGTLTADTYVSSNATVSSGSAEKEWTGLNVH